MKLAIVHDDLIQFGGAENLLMALHSLWPNAPIYTSVASKRWKEICKEENIDLRTSFMQKLPFAEKLNRHYSPFLMHALAFQSFRFDDYDIVISSSSRYAHSIITKPQTKHVCYMNSPGRMFWESDEYFEHEQYGFLKSIKKLAKPFLSIFLSHLRQWDYISAQRVDYFIANSNLIKERIKKYYKRNSTVIYPFIDYDTFSSQKVNDGEYFLVLTRLSPWKRVDIAIEACNKLKLPLKVVGFGSDLHRLEKLAGPTVDILGYVSDERKIDLYERCKALIVTQKEDFGITPLEAMALGKPVIAFREGGVQETVIEGNTGEFFDEQSSESLEKVLESFNEDKYSLYHCKDRAKKFSRHVFDRKINQFINAVFDEKVKNGKILMSN